MPTATNARARANVAAFGVALGLLAAGCSSSGTAATPTDGPAASAATTSVPAIRTPTTAAPSPAAAPATIAPETTAHTTTTAGTTATFAADSALATQLAGSGISPAQFTVGEFVFDAIVAGPDDGEVAMLLHGFPSTNYQWRFQIAALADAGYRVIAPNQRGYSAGARPTDIDDYSIDLLAQDVVDIADAAGVDRFHLVGHDWGAAVTWMVGINHPDRLLSLTAVSVPHPAAYGTARQDPLGEQSAKAGYIDLFVQPGFEDSMVADNAAFLTGLYASAGLDNAEMQPYLDVLGTADAAGAALNWYRANSLDATPDAPAVSTPTLFVFSTNDCCLGRDAADLTVDYVTGPYTYEVLEGVSHWITEEAPTALNDLLLTHLAANPA